MKIFKKCLFRSGTIYEQIEVIDVLKSNIITKKRIWGNGKVVCNIHGTTPYYAVGDAHKNITEYIDASGTIQAHYEYSPFGKITASYGAMENNFDYRFSSEVFDTETGLVYYNYRYYSSELGRWLSRDPKYIRGSIAWMKFNREDEISEKIQNVNQLLQLLSLLYELYPHLNKVPQQFFIDFKAYLEFELVQEISGTKSNSNPYSFVLNASINDWDYLGLQDWRSKSGHISKKGIRATSSDGLKQAGGNGPTTGSDYQTAHDESQRMTNKFIDKFDFTKKLEGAISELDAKYKKKKQCPKKCPPKGDEDSKFYKFLDATIGNTIRGGKLVVDSIIALFTWDRGALRK